MFQCRKPDGGAPVVGGCADIRYLRPAAGTAALPGHLFGEQPGEGGGIQPQVQEPGSADQTNQPQREEGGVESGGPAGLQLYKVFLKWAKQDLL